MFLDLIIVSVLRQHLFALDAGQHNLFGASSAILGPVVHRLPATIIIVSRESIRRGQSFISHTLAFLPSQHLLMLA
jgi:hypothetical protein